MKKFRILGGNKPGIELTPEIIVKKSNLAKQMLAEGFIKLMSMIDENSQFLKMRFKQCKARENIWLTKRLVTAETALTGERRPLNDGDRNCYHFKKLNYNIVT